MNGMFAAVMVAGVTRHRKFQISDLRFEIEETANATAVESVTRSEVGHVFLGFTRAGAASERPYGEEPGALTLAHRTLTSEGNG